MRKRHLITRLVVSTIALSPVSIGQAGAQTPTTSSLQLSAASALALLPTVWPGESTSSPTARRSEASQRTLTVAPTKVTVDHWPGPIVSATPDRVEPAAANEINAGPPRSYPGELESLARAVATRVPVDSAALAAMWQRTDPVRMRVVLTALTQVGAPYRYGGNDPNGFDCSGLTSYAWAAAGIKIPRTSSDQIAASRITDIESLKPGDLLWRPGHIGLALGIDDLMVNATQTGKPVEVKRWGRLVQAGSPIAA